jgi:hypothetical protein
MTVGVHARNAILVVFAGVMTVSLAEAEVDSSALPSSADASESVAEPVIALDYLVIGEDAAAFFDVIARALSVRLDLSDKVHGTLSKTRLSGTSDKILDEAAQKLGLDWFTFNGVLYVSNRSEAVTRIVRLGGLKAGRVLAVLAENGLAVERLDIKPSADGAALALSGPPKLLALVETMIEGIAPVPVERLAESAAKIVTVRRGNEAEMVRLP